MPRWSKRCSECDVKWIKSGEDEMNHTWHTRWIVECDQCRNTVLVKPLIWHVERNYLSSGTSSSKSGSSGLVKKNP